jgi:hypothetical protein
VSTTDFAEQRDDLLRSIERDQQSVRVAVHELTEAAHSKLSVGERIDEFPLTWVVGGFLFGAWLGWRRGGLVEAVRQRRR